MSEVVKKYILLTLFFCVCSICFAQERVNKDSIQICYRIGSSGIGGQDHCVTIWFEDSLIFCQRICYSIFNHNPKCIDTTLSNIDVDLTRERYQKSTKQTILCNYQESRNFFILDERVEISKSQFDELIKLINEIKAYVSKEESNSDEIIISTKRNHYVIKDKNGTTIIVDWLGRYDRSKEIEKVLGLKSYLRCPCVEEDLKQMNNRRKRRTTN